MCVATPDRFNVSRIVAVGEKVNVSCSTTSADPVDFYHQKEEGASPVPICANNIPLNDRYDVVSLTGECREVGGSERLHNGLPGAIALCSAELSCCSLGYTLF